MRDILRIYSLCQQENAENFYFSSKTRKQKVGAGGAFISGANFNVLGDRKMVKR
jgi:hypothetical protein